MADDDDYELLPHDELEQLRKELSAVRKGSPDSKLRELQISVDKLNVSISKLISILEDAQQDIINEYQDSKPAEKLNQLLDQNETIAKALITINDSLKKPEDDFPISKQYDASLQQPAPPMQDSGQFQQPFQQRAPQMQFQPSLQQPQFQPPFQPSLQQNQQPMQFSQQPQFQQPQFQQPPPMQRPVPQQPIQQPMQNPDIQFNTLPPLDNMPGEVPPLNPEPEMLPEHRRKKFLGLI